MADPDPIPPSGGGAEAYRARRAAKIPAYADNGFTACEIQAVFTASGANPDESFCRLVCNDTSVLTRRGFRGMNGRVRIDTFATTAEARRAFVTHRTDQLRGIGFREVFMCGEDDPIRTEPDLAAAEAYLLKCWSTDTLRILDPGPKPTNWVVFEGLLAERGKQAGVDALVAELLDAPHATDHRTDHIVAVAGDFTPYGHVSYRISDNGTRATGYRWRAHMLGPATTTDITNPTAMAEMVLGMINGRQLERTSYDDIDRIIVASRRLLGAHQ